MSESLLVFHRQTFLADTMLHLSLPGLSGGTPLTIVANLIAGGDELTGLLPALSETCTYKINDMITKLTIELPGVTVPLWVILGILGY